jgi:hypothetical protein
LIPCTTPNDCLAGSSCAGTPPVAFCFP